MRHWSVEERRVLGRVTPRSGLAGRIGHTTVRILDISLRGSLVAHDEPLSVGSTAILMFPWEGTPIEARCEIVRSRVAPPIHSSSARFHTGLRIVDLPEGSVPLLRQMILWHVSRALEEQIADARGVSPPPSPAACEQAPLYVRCDLTRGSWRRRYTSATEQPEVGFTVRASESYKDILCLCDTYRSGDREVRDLVQLMAAVSLEDEPSFAVRSFQP
jgi:hypothetical protein